MNEEQITELLNQIIDSSKYKNTNPEQRETMKKKIIQKYINDFNLTALEMIDSSKQNEFSQILASGNQAEVENFIAKNIPDIETLTKKTTEKFSNELYEVLKTDSN